jgi:hypothetical protein
VALEESTTGVLIRTLYANREDTVPPRMRIERLDRPKPRPVEPEEMSAGLAKAGQIVLGYAELVRAWWQNNLSQRPNSIDFSEATYLSNGGVLDRLHGFGAWQKEKDEALVIRFSPPECEYWIFQVCNRWQENLDVYEDGQGYITKFTARHEEDGSVLAILSDRDPGLGGNWIDSFQHEAGVFSLRLIQTEGGPPIRIHRVNLESLEEKGWRTLEDAEPIASGIVTD